MHNQLFQSLEVESDVNLVTYGEIPQWLNGTFVRNGPAKFEQGNHHFHHWFDGYAMLHAFTFRQGKVKYTNRFLQSDYLKNDVKTQSINWPYTFGDADHAPQSVWDKVKTAVKMRPSDNNNVNVVKMGEKYFTTSDLNVLVEFDINTLATKGIHHFDDKLPTSLRSSSAHPCYDPVTQEYFNFFSEPGPVTYYYLYRIKPNSNRRETLAKIKRDGVCFLHASALTPNYYILIDCPLEATLWDMVKLRVNQGALSRATVWNPNKPSFFHLVNRSTGEVQSLSVPPFYFYHVINGFEEDGKLHIDLCRLNRGDVADHLKLAQLKTTGVGKDDYAVPTRYTIDLTFKKVTERRLGEHFLEMPQINPQMQLQKNRYAYGVGRFDFPEYEFYNQLTKLDLQTSKQFVWRQMYHYPSEPIFVPNPEAKREDDGVVLSVIADVTQKHSFLLVLDAKTFTEIARMNLPHTIPYGFHGNFFAELPAEVENLQKHGFQLNPL